MKIGYCRVSTDDQNTDLQLVALKRTGCNRIFTDKATGAHVKWPHWRMLTRFDMRCRLEAYRLKAIPMVGWRCLGLRYEIAMAIEP
jgi:Resolvase, N terminal domain